MQRFRQMRSLQIFVTVYGAVYSQPSLDPHLSSRTIFKATHSYAFAEWRSLGAA